MMAKHDPFFSFKLVVAVSSVTVLILSKMCTAILQLRLRLGGILD